MIVGGASGPWELNMQLVPKLKLIQQGISGPGILLGGKRVFPLEFSEKEFPADPLPRIGKI